MYICVPTIRVGGGRQISKKLKEERERTFGAGEQIPLSLRLKGRRSGRAQMWEGRRECEGAPPGGGDRSGMANFEKINK